MAISLIIADDVEDTRAGIRRLLSLDPEIKVIGEAADGRQAVEETINLKPDMFDGYQYACYGRHYSH